LDSKSGGYISREGEERKGKKGIPSLSKKFGRAAEYPKKERKKGRVWRKEASRTFQLQLDPGTTP